MPRTNTLPDDTGSKISLCIVMSGRLFSGIPKKGGLFKQKIELKATTGEL